MPIYHLAEAAHWAVAASEGYPWSTRGATVEQVGFVHASDAHQVDVVAAYVFAGAEEPLVLLELDEAAIATAGVEVRREDGGDGELFPHIYGVLDPAWVTAVTPYPVPRTE